MLLNDFFIIDDWQAGEGLAKAILHINWGHPIFEGHFHDRPVVPGACLLQLVKELVSMGTGADVRLVRADQLKFISMISPDLNETVWINLHWNEGPPSPQPQPPRHPDATSPQPASLRVTAEGIHADEIFFRFKGSFLTGSDYAD